MEYPLMINKDIIYSHINSLENSTTITNLLDICVDFNNNINISKFFELCILHDYLDIVQYLYEDLYIEYDINVLNSNKNINLDDEILNDKYSKHIIKKYNKTIQYLYDMKIYSKFRKYYYKNKWLFLYKFNL